MKKLLAMLMALMIAGCCHAGRAGSDGTGAAMKERPAFRALVLCSLANDHTKMIGAAVPLLHRLAEENHFAVDITNDPFVVTDENLKRYQVFVQLHEAPFDLSTSQQGALQRFIEAGGGWVGIHAAGLTGKTFLGPHPAGEYWQWFEDFLGGAPGLTYSPHPKYQAGVLTIEDHTHPATRHLPATMRISDEWYEFNRSPRGTPGIRVLATADETTYHQNHPMGDHPLIWVNEKYPRTIYIAIGHDPSLLADLDYQVLLRDSILWAGGK